jgi:hypothetical protein
MKVTIADIMVIYREIELPEHCPSCNSDLTKEGAIAAWEYQDQKRYGALDKDSQTFKDSEKDYGVPEGGESFLSYVAYWCHDCSEMLESEGAMEEHDLRGIPAGGESRRFPKKQWQEEVAAGATRRGYEAWLGAGLRELKSSESEQLDEQG